MPPIIFALLLAIEMMRFVVLLLFAGVVFGGALFVGPLYREYVEQDLSRQTRRVLNEKGWHGTRISYDHLTVKAQVIEQAGKVGREIDREVWGAYLPPNAIKANLRPPANLIISINRETKSVVLRGTLPDSKLRQVLQKAVADAEGISEVDNIIVIDNRLASPAWSEAAPTFITAFINAKGTEKMTLNPIGGLKLEGSVDFEMIKTRLGKQGGIFSKVENLLQINPSKKN